MYQTNPFRTFLSTFLLPRLLPFIYTSFSFSIHIFTSQFNNNSLRTLPMAEAKQPILNGAYYGPSIPPQRSYHRHGRGGGFCCGPCCLLSFLCQLIATIVVLVGIAILVIWLVYRPTNIKFHVVNASLTEFNLTANNQIGYNLALDISVRNPNTKIGVYYENLEARAYYQGESFATIPLGRFYQGHKNTTILHPVFQGNSTILLSGSGLTMFDGENNDGTFNIDIRIYLRIRFKVGGFKTYRLKPEIKCDIRVPLASTRVSAGVFNTKRCKVYY